MVVHFPHEAGAVLDTLHHTIAVGCTEAAGHTAVEIRAVAVDHNLSVAPAAVAWLVQSLS